MSGDELHLWQWRYTDEFGKRRVFPCRLTEEAGKKLKDAERVEGIIEIPEPFHTRVTLLYRLALARLCP